MRAHRLTIKRVPIDRYNPAPYNPRKSFRPGDTEYEKLKRSLEQFGCVDPIIVNKRTSNLVGGHLRRQVLKDRGDTHIDVSVVDLSPAKEKALNIALNKIQGEFDEAKLAALLDELGRSSELDLVLTGFEIPEAQDLIGRFVDPDTTTAAIDSFDETAELAAASRHPIVTKPGDIIELGRDLKLRHRLICGDCTDVAVANATERCCPQSAHCCANDRRFRLMCVAEVALMA